MWKWMRKNKKKQGDQKPSYNESDTLPEFIEVLGKSEDFIQFELDGTTRCTVSYLKTMSDSKILNRSVLTTLNSHDLHSLKEIKETIPVENVLITDDLKVIQTKVMFGYIMIQVKSSVDKVLLVPAVSLESRDVGIPEVEFSVVGPKEAFVETINTNINLIRKRLPLPQLTVKELQVGKMTSTRTAVIYIDGVADKDNVDTVTQRLQDIEYDQLVDSSFITQMIADNSNSPFPQLLDTERPDRVVSNLAEGKIAILVDGSPHALTCPTTVVEFFGASDDYYLTWHLASVFRLIRLFAVIFSVLSTPLYVAVLTYHFEMIPPELMATIVSSRSDIPFPPILEVIILELTIELLREAGARLPTKIGQTIGIVGGIVIGTAAVDAGLTSNVLLIIVALSALASFTTPVYQIGNTIRLIRFPFLMGAQLWGLVGVSMCMVFYIGHLIKLQSIGRPFFEPLYPLRFKDLKDAFIRLPFPKQVERPVLMRSEDPIRMNKDRVKAKRDIDE
ncbi:spore germination protein [Halobacillus litoralis]|uniref:Spore germination protein n=2 Tax=Halobacillus litoralis TaxID=45668 RepID=A0A845DSW8_9BACI|nr:MULTISPECIES: spore germination protein [Halobacillus]MYL20693.1 spore germination protein [Halobacillus litoralis]MYL29783.1 spore germination protein [Halobacillus halophilus]MYL39283.1 spore germination protein [Halobacillus litoralis]